MVLIGRCMQCERGLQVGDTKWTLNINHEKAEDDLRPNGSQGVCIQVLDAWEILCLCEDCMKKQVGSWMEGQVSEKKQFDEDRQIPGTITDIDG